jgi:hypothetical protein
MGSGLIACLRPDIESHVVDPASIAVPRRHRRAKTDVFRAADRSRRLFGGHDELMVYHDTAHASRRRRSHARLCSPRIGRAGRSTGTRHGIKCRAVVKSP